MNRIGSSVWSRVGINLFPRSTVSFISKIYKQCWRRKQRESTTHTDRLVISMATSQESTTKPPRIAGGSTRMVALLLYACTILTDFPSWSVIAQNVILAKAPKKMRREWDISCPFIHPEVITRHAGFPRNQERLSSHPDRFGGLFKLRCMGLADAHRYHLLINCCSYLRGFWLSSHASHVLYYTDSVDTINSSLFDSGTPTPPLSENCTSQIL